MRWTHENALRRDGCGLIAGVDEVGRGSLAGPVVAAAVILDRGCRLRGVKDSKLLTEERRRGLFGHIVLSAVAYGFGVAEAEVVDEINVFQATLVAMRDAVAALPTVPDALLIDAVRLPAVPLRQLSLIHGDARSPSIAAASILAKVFRDEMMRAFDDQFPAYCFHRNKGYGTEEHRRTLGDIGPSPLHRRTFSWTQPCLLEGED